MPGPSNILPLGGHSSEPEKKPQAPFGARFAPCWAIGKMLKICAGRLFRVRSSHFARDVFLWGLKPIRFAPQEGVDCVFELLQSLIISRRNQSLQFGYFRLARGYFSSSGHLAPPSSCANEKTALGGKSTQSGYFRLGVTDMLADARRK
jgi:hypothetical protein